MAEEVNAFLIAEKLNLDEIRTDVTYHLLYKDSDELFYQSNNFGYIYILKYGAIVFFRIEPIEQTKFLHHLKNYASNPFTDKYSDTFFVEIHPDEYKILYNQIILKELNNAAIRIIMLNLAQTVALEYFTKQSEMLIEETRVYTTQLEYKGHIGIRGKKLRKYIGRTLNIKNRIAENLYIFDSPKIAWENETLDQIDNDLEKVFDLENRYHNVLENLNIVKENLDLFKDLSFHRHSSYLEWVIIGLILFEVLNMIISKIFF